MKVYQVKSTSEDRRQAERARSQRSRSRLVQEGMPQADSPLVVPPGGGLVFGPGGSTLLARASDTGGVLGVLALGPMPRGRWVPAHTHHAAAEAWYVLEGGLTFRFGTRLRPRRKRRLPPGTRCAGASKIVC
jgi:mannose-6-phosphate isomerase-like protein (cupin superfamily)